MDRGLTHELRRELVRVDEVKYDLLQFTETPSNLKGVIKTNLRKLGDEIPDFFLHSQLFFAVLIDNQQLTLNFLNRFLNFLFALLNRL